MLKDVRSTVSSILSGGRTRESRSDNIRPAVRLRASLRDTRRAQTNASVIITGPTETETRLTAVG